ncbi:hypothetical protein VTP01DRAFT_10641 [Rhizomucor pusillus]|uniref:uncharacterized protein n=1 Tax=Rhizomucor pusillus TaxID=4840 RepID=UPI00374235F0
MEDSLARRSQGLREPVALFHLLFTVAGLALLSFGAYTINAPIISPTVSIVLVAVGFIVAVISFIAYFGAHIEHSGFLKSYSGATALFLIIEVVLIALAYAHRREMDHYASVSWDFFAEHDSKFLLNVEQAFQCCGYNSPHDRPIPSSTCPGMTTPSAYAAAGCKETIVATLADWREYILATGLVLLAIKLTALLTCVILAIMIEKDAEEERTYMTLLSTQSNAWLDGSPGSPSSLSNGRSGSPILGRHPPWSRSSLHSYSSSHPPTYHSASHQQRIPRYGSTASTTSK